MEEFKVVLKKRIMLLSFFTVMSLLFIGTAGVWGYRQISISSHIQSFIYGAQTGLFAGLLVVVLGKTIKYATALKTDDKIKAIYIEENDERKKLINDKIGGVGYNFALGALTVAIVIAGFFNEVVFLTLLGTIFFMSMIKAFLKVYYSRKY